MTVAVSANEGGRGATTRDAVAAQPFFQRRTVQDAVWIGSLTLLVALAERYVSGLHVEGSSQLYVSRGTRYWGPPMRLFAPHELTVLTLRSA